MDILSHALWTAAAAIPLRHMLRTPINSRWVVFWGVFPDVFSFTIPAAIRIWWYATGVTPHLLPDAKSTQHFQFVWQLYYCSHSLVIFAATFGIVWVLAQRPVLELLGWGLHILIDISTHQGIFALHFLWPFSSYGLSGLRWESHWFLAANYGTLLVLYSWIWSTRRWPRPGRHV